MRFVALDLETTGLSPETDTIIEVAAIAFGIEKNATGRYEATNIIEHSQLVYPGRAMTEEISMITGITDDMLVGKPMWESVRERVKDFIGDDIIVGHNVLFDIAMFGTHGIDLTQHPTLDTFELSEILSQEAESLNLGYLSGLYGISAGDKEHRALGDTRLSVGLFVHYLNQSAGLPDTKKAIFTLAGQHEERANLGLFAEILGWEKDCTIVPVVLTKEESMFQKTVTLDPSYRRMTKTGYRDSPPLPYSLSSLPLGRESEKEFLEKNIARGVQTSIGVFGHIQTNYMKTLIEELGYSAEIYRTREEYCSVEELRERIARQSWGRKESILITKLLYWLEDTPTGLLRELKLYGEEREEIVYFRMRDGEDNQYYRASEDSISHVNVIIYDMTKHLSQIIQSSQSREKTEHESLATIPPGGREQDTISPTSYLTTQISDTLIIKDITLLEESMRRAESTHISIERLISTLSELSGTERLREIIRFIEGMYLDFPVRPTGPEVNPPGGYGETYFLPQSEIWYRGGVNLSLLSSSLFEALGSWRETRTIQTRRERYLVDSIEKSLIGLLCFHQIQASIGVIIEIRENCLSLSLIPRDVQDNINKFLSLYKNVTLYGVGIGGTKIQEFLRHEAGIRNNIEEAGEKVGGKNKKYLTVNPYATIELKKSGDLGGTVILTTSAKHIREIGKSLEKTGFKILMQGISGGKGKQLGLFMANPANTILIGTIDMWREELKLWNHAKNIILAKLPFDPPTDTYFLARTVGMKNNFTLYSEPMLIIKVNTLLSRISSSNYSGVVYCEDNRLTETTWGKEIISEII